MLKAEGGRCAKSSVESVHVVHCLDGLRGGVFCMLRNYGKMMERTFFDFIVRSDVSEAQVREVEKWGGKVVACCADTGDKLALAVEQAARAAKGDAVFHVHCNFRNLEPARIARRSFKTVISHAHLVYPPSNFVVGAYRVAFRSLIKGVVDYSWGCSSAAVEMLYGRNPKNPAVIPNPIDFDRYRFSVESRDRVRERLGLNDRPIVLHCGLPIAQKNHYFLFQVFKELLTSCPDAMLLLVGPDRVKDREIASVCDALGLSENVCFLGYVADPETYCSAADAVCFPSFNEGMPLALLEAQMSGLPFVTSDAISSDADLFGHARFLPLAASPTKWANELLGLLGGRYVVTRDMAVGSGFEARSCARLLEGSYVRMV